MWFAAITFQHNSIFSGKSNAYPLTRIVDHR